MKYQIHYREDGDDGPLDFIETFVEFQALINFVKEQRNRGTGFRLVDDPYMISPLSAKDLEDFNWLTK